MKRLGDVRMALQPLPVAADVTLKIFDVAGREVATLLDRAFRPPGRYQVQVDGRALRSGVYLCHLVAGRTVETRKMIVYR